MVAMNTATQKEQQVAQFVARKCRQFLTNISRYDRDHRGQYRWAYQGYRHLIRLTLEEYEAFYALGLNDGLTDQPLTLSINGRLIGNVTIFSPYSYPSPFMTIDFVEGMQYRPEVITRFAQYAGYTETVDRSLLEIKRSKVTEDDLVY